MSVSITIYVICDKCTCSYQSSSGYSRTSAKIIKDVIAESKRFGWEQKRIRGETVHICPECIEAEKEKQNED